MNVVAVFNTVGGNNIGLENFIAQSDDWTRVVVVTDQSESEARSEIERNYKVTTVGIISLKVGSLTNGVRKLYRLTATGGTVLHVHHAKSAALTGLLRIATRSRLTATAHNDFGLYGLKQKLALSLAYLVSDRVICNSEGTKKSLPRFVRRSKTSVIYNGVNFTKLDAAVKSYGDRMREQSVIIGTICRMVPQKDIHTLLRAFAKSLSITRSSLRLRLVGDGPERRSIENTIRELDINNHVELTGQLSRDDAYRALSGMDIFVVSSRWEGFCNAMVEAGAEGTAIVASKIEPLPEVIGKSNAVFFEVGDSESLGLRLVELVEDETRRRELAERAREFVRARYSLDYSAAQYRHVYLELADELREPRS